MAQLDGIPLKEDPPPITPERNEAYVRLSVLQDMQPKLPAVLYALIKVIGDEPTEDEIYSAFDGHRCGVTSSQLRAWANTYRQDMEATAHAARQRALAKLNDEDRKALGV